MHYLGEIKSGYRSSLYYFTCDIVNMVREALSLCAKGDNVSFLTRLRLRMFKLGDDDAEKQRSQGRDAAADDDEHVVGLEKDVELLLRRVVFKWLKSSLLK